MDPSLQGASIAFLALFMCLCIMLFDPTEWSSPPPAKIACEYGVPAPPAEGTSSCVHNLSHVHARMNVEHYNLSTAPLHADLTEARKQRVYARCRAWNAHSLRLGALELDSSNHTLRFKNPRDAEQPMHILWRTSPRLRPDPGERAQAEYVAPIDLYLLAQNLHALTPAQRDRVTLSLFLSDAFTPSQRDEWALYAYNLFAPWTRKTNVVIAPRGNQPSYDYMMGEFVRRNRDVAADTILFLLEDDYICSPTMVREVMEFFGSHDPCVVHPSDYADRYTSTIDGDRGETIVMGKNRHWRSISSTTVTYALRLETYLALKDDLMRPVRDWGASAAVRARAGERAMASPMPGLCSHRAFVSTRSARKEEFAVGELLQNWDARSEAGLRAARRLPCFPASLKDVPDSLFGNRM